jgi:hypothetical protein
LPIYPLDGGQLLNRVFLNEESWVSKIFVYLSVALLTWFALFRIGYPLGLPLLLFPAMMLLRLFGDSKITNIEKRIEEEGINVDCSYEDLSDENYWKIRKILIQEHASFKDLEIETGDQYENSAKEEKVMQMIQTFLHRHLIQDMPALGKVLVLVICVAAFASPWLLKMDMSIFRQFGF